MPPKLSTATLPHSSSDTASPRSSASRSSRDFSPSHTTSSSALVATASAAANLLPPAPYLFSRKAANLAWPAAVSAAFDAALFLPRPPPRLPPPRPRPLKMA
jgi:hypothetical protein